MAFMQKDVTGMIDWLEIDTYQGTWFVPAYDAPQTALDFVAACHDGLHTPDEAPATVKCGLLDYTEAFEPDHIMSVSMRRGYGARFDAPGYLDCTEWCVFDTETEANEYLDELDA